MASPHPKPTALKLLQGNPGKRALPVDEPTPEALPADTPAPEKLTDAAKVEWARLLPVLSGMRVMTLADVDALGDLCEAIAEEAYCNRMLTEDGWLHVAKSGYQQQSPWFTVRKDAQARKLKLMSLFGMTPSDRTKVKTVSAPKKANKFL